MKCPACQVKMNLYRQSDLDCYSCVHGCGIWIHPRSKWNFILRTQNNTEDVWTKIQMHQKCPECTDQTLQVVKVKLEKHSQNIESHICARCKGLFISCIDFRSLRSNRKKKRKIKFHTRLYWKKKETATDKYYRGQRRDRELDIQDYAFSFLIGLPIEINLPPQKIPVITLTFFAANILLFLILSQSAVTSLALVPANLKISTFITSIFIHGSWIHLLGNMYFLYILGDNVEDRLGKLKYTLFYFSCGIVASLIYLVFNGQSSIPVVGASGAISGIMGAYLIACHKAQFGIMILFIMIKIPAVAYFAFWIFIQFVLSTMNTNVAWEAHLGGFFAGFILYPILKNISQRK